jgi:amidase
VGTETSGLFFLFVAKFIIGLKPTTGLLSRSGIVQSQYLDTPGPMTKNITDSGILLSAMSGQDTNDPATKTNQKHTSIIKTGTLKDCVLALLKPFRRFHLQAISIPSLKAVQSLNMNPT